MPKARPRNTTRKKPFDYKSPFLRKPIGYTNPDAFAPPSMPPPISSKITPPFKRISSKKTKYGFGTRKVTSRSKRSQNSYTRKKSVKKITRARRRR
jgi:hypothetical protein